MNIVETNLRKNGELSYGNNPRYIVLHHAEASNCTIESINNWHIDGNGWVMCGYHYFVRKDGSIYSGRPERAMGAHCPTRNANSIGICAEGSYMTETMPEVQKQAIIDLIADIKNRYNIIEVGGHNKYYSTNCPGKNYPLDDIINGNVQELSEIPADFDEEFYLSTYTDVAEAVSKGDFKNGLEHYRIFGYKEGRKFKKERKYIITKYLPYSFDNYVDVDNIIHRYFENIKVYIRSDAKGCWLESAYIDNPEQLNRIANNLANDNLFHAVQ